MSKRIQITRALMAVVLLSAFLAAFLINRYQYFHVGAAILSRELSNRTGDEVVIRRLGGSVIRDLELRAVSITTPDGVRAAAKSVRLEYSLFDLVFRPPRAIRTLTVESPAVVLPVARGRDEDAARGPLPAIAPPSVPVFVESLSVRDGTVSRGGSLICRFAADASLEPAGEGCALRLRRLAVEAAAGDTLLPISLAGSAVWGDEGSVSAEFGGRAGETAFRIRGEHTMGDGFPGRGSVDLEPLAISQILDLAGVEAAVDTAEARVAVRYAGRVDSCGVTLSGTARFDHFRADSLHMESTYREGRFIVEHLTGRVNGASFRGEGEFDVAEGEKNSIHLEFEGVDVSRFAPEMAGSRSSDLNGELHWEGSGNELTTLSGRLRFDLGPSNVGAIGIRRASIRGSAFPGGFSVEGSEVRTRRSLLQFGGVARLDGSLEGRLTGEIPSLGEFRALTPFDTLGGAVEVSAAVSGRVDSFLAEGSAVVESASVEGVTCARTELDGWLRYDYGSVTAGGEAVGRRIRAGSDRVDSLRMEVGLDRDTLSLRDLSAWRQEWYLFARGEATASESDRSLDLRDVRLLRGDEVIAEPERLRFWKRGERAGVGPFAFPFGNGFVRASARSGPGDSVDVSLAVEGCDLSLLSARAGVDPELLRKVDLTANVTGTSAEPIGEVHLHLSGVEEDSLPFRELVADGRFRDSHVLIDSATVSGYAPGAALDIRGSLPIPFEREDGEFRLDLDMRRYPIRELHFLTDHLADFEGRARLSIRARGSWDQPNFTADFTVDSTMWHGFPMGTVRADSISYAGDSLLATLRLDGSWGEGNRLFWRLPARLSLGERDFDFLDTGPFRARLLVPDGDFSLAYALTDVLEDASGRFLLDVELEGDRSDPEMRGQFELQDGFLLPAQIASYFDDVEARVLLHEDYLTVVSCEVRSQDRGRLDVWGRIDLDGLEPAGYDLEARAKRYRILLADGVEGTLVTTFDGDLEIVTDNDYLDRLVPQIRGDALLRETLIEMEFREPVEGVQSVFDPTTEPTWTLDLQVNAPKKIIARNSVLDADLGGEAHLTRSSAGFGGVGEFEIFRGTYWVLNNQFRDVQGTLILADPDDLRNVVLDVTARTEILGERIEVGVTGKPDSLVVTSNSESGMTEGEILAMLTFRARPEETVRSGELLSSWITSFANRFSREMTRGLGDVGTIEIGTSDDLPEIRYGNYFSSDLFLGFSQKLGSPLDAPGREQGPYRENLPVPERQVRVEYRLRRSLVVQGEAGTFDDGGRFVNLDLKVKLPY